METHRTYNESPVTSLHDQNPNKRENEKIQDLVWAYNRRVDIELAPKGVHSTQFYPGNAPEADFLANKNRPGENSDACGREVKAPDRFRTEPVALRAKYYEYGPLFGGLKQR